MRSTRTKEDSKNGYSLDDWIEENNPDILLLQETKRTKKSSKIEVEGNYNVVLRFLLPPF